MEQPSKPNAGNSSGNNKSSFKHSKHNNAEKRLTIGNDIWFDTSDILQRLPVTARTLLNWRKAGVLRSHKLGGKIFYCESDLLRLTQ